MERRGKGNGCWEPGSGVMDQRQNVPGAPLQLAGLVRAAESNHHRLCSGADEILQPGTHRPAGAASKLWIRDMLSLGAP